MADFNVNALGAFRNVDFGNADAIANLKQGGGVERHGRLGGFFAKMFRSSATEERNNAVRTELLKALGQGFGIEGMTEKDGKEVVRPLTAEDVDTIGKACLFNSVNI